MARAAMLPAARSSFVGRTEELVRVVGEIRGSTRLLTLVGVGGTGKTRLALEAARSLAEHGAPEGGVHFCDLSHARGEDDVCRAVASALRVALERGADAAPLLARALAGRAPTLLVLDNFEQIVAAAPATAGAWLDAAPELRLLVTSREPLRLRGEVVFEVPTLPTARGAEARSDAAELFVERARAMRAASLPSDTSVIDRIVEALDGLPLAIELAAARLSVLSADELLALLPRPFDVLTRGARDLPERQSSLERALDWSWDRLDDRERTAFARCAVFHGGFTRDAAEAVFAPESAAGALDLLQSLRDKSLLLVEPAASPDEPPRFGMLGTVRAYAEARLRATGGYREARARHARHYLARARSVAAGLSGADSRRHMAVLTAELDNLAAIADGAGEGEEEAAAALSVLLAIEALFDLRGPAFDALRRLDAALAAAAAARSPLPPDLLAEARRLRGKVRRMHGMLGPAAEDVDAALSAARERGDRVAEGRALVELSLVHRTAGRSPEVERAASLAVAALESSSAAGALLGFARGMVAIGAHSQGRLDEARPIYQRALEELAAAGDRRAEGVLLGSFGFLWQDLGELDEAERQYRRALDIHRDLGNRRSEGVVLGYLGNVQRSRGDQEGAARRYADATALLREQGDEQFEGVFYMDWGILLVDHGRPDEARKLFEEALVHLGRAGDGRCAALVLGHLGAVHAAASRIEESAACFEDAAAKLRASGDPHFAQVVGVLEGQLDVARAVRARAAADEAAIHAGLSAARERLLVARRVERASEHVVFARRRLESALDLAEPPAEALVVSADATWFRAPRAELVDLAPRQPLRRMLSALTDARIQLPGKPLAVDALFAAGWPGERIQRGAMHNRVRVALSTLRKLGLASALKRKGEGWMLDPAIPFVRPPSS